MRRWLLHILIVLAACAAVYWPMLSAAGFASSEGHRVGPAWEMLQTGDWTHLRLFELPYLRKPPGMPWAIALSSSIFGPTEFAARAVSALASTLMALVALWFGNRWLGPPWGLASGLAQALSPLFVTIGRTAEIDPLNALGAQIAGFALLSLVQPIRSGRALPGAVILLPLGIILAGLAKGPASLPLLIGIGFAACLRARSFAPLASWRLGVGVLIGGGFLAVFGAWFARHNAAPGAVLQDFSEFTWSWTRLAGTATLLPAAFLAAAPASGAIIVLLVHQREAPERRDAEHLPMANLLALSWLCSIAVLLVTGSSNPRYAMPAGVLLAPLAAWALRACWLARSISLPARLGMLGHPVVPALLLLLAATVWVQADSRRPRLQEGRAAGRSLAAALPDHAVVWCNDLVEARPDILLYTQRARPSARPRWNKVDLLAARLPPEIETGTAVHYLLLRDDQESDEVQRFDPLIDQGRLSEIASGTVAKYQWRLFRVLIPTQPPSPSAAPGSAGE